VSSEFILWHLKLPDRGLLFPPQSSVAFINSKKLQWLSSFPSPYIKQYHIWTLPCFRFLASLSHNYSTRQIGTSISHGLTAKTQVGFRQDWFFGFPSTLLLTTASLLHFNEQCHFIWIYATKLLIIAYRICKEVLFPSLSFVCARACVRARAQQLRRFILQFWGW
jgi:hypothetical protein